MSIKNNFFPFLNGFKFAFKGILTCLKSERNLRFHLCIAFYILLFMRFYKLTKVECALIFLTIGSVISLEMINTAIETVVDLCSPKYNNLAKKAKDAAAGAVLCSAIFSVAVGISVFWDIDTFREIYLFFINHFIAFVGLIVSIVLWVILIFFVKTDKNNAKYTHD